MSPWISVIFAEFSSSWARIADHGLTDATCARFPRAPIGPEDAAAFSAAAAATALSATSMDSRPARRRRYGTRHRDFRHRRGDLADMTECLVGIQLYVLTGHSCSSLLTCSVA